MKYLVLIGIHGSAGSKPEWYSPIYRWGFDRNNFPNITLHYNTKHITDCDIDNGVYWRNILNIAQEMSSSDKYVAVHVIMDRGFKRGLDIPYITNKVLSLSKRDDCESIEIISTGKSLGGIHIMRILRRIERKIRNRKKYNGTVTAPYTVLVDPDNFITKGFTHKEQNGRALRIIPKIASNVDVFIERSDFPTSFWKNVLYGRIICRRHASKDSRYDNVRHYKLRPDLRFPELESHKEFQDEPVNHWTIDEYMTIYGWNKNSVEDLLRYYMLNGTAQNLSDPLVIK